jgi:hypothetical protein
MRPSLLVHHPAPDSTESFLGYLLRLSQVNGYRSPWSIFALARMKQHEIRTTGIRANRLAAIANCDVSKLEAIAYSAPRDNPRWCRILGHPLVLADLSLRNPKLCPQCIEERGFIEAHWDLTFMMACKIHQSLAISHCPKCEKPLRWFRPGILECECGGNLIRGDRPPTTQALTDLMTVIRAKVLGEELGSGNSSSRSLSELLAMDLRGMLSVIRILGKHRRIADGDSSADGARQVVAPAAEVLADWPKNFIGLLQDLGKSLRRDGKSSVRGQFQGIYGSLFKNKAIASPRQVDFLRAAFLEFVTNHWDGGFVDHKLLKALGATTATRKRFITQTEFAARLGVQQSTAARFLHKQKVPSVRVRSGKSLRILIDHEEISLPQTMSGTIYGARDAAKLLGFSVSVLQSLRKIGIYEIRSMLPTRAGYHEQDIQSLSQRLLSLSEGNSQVPLERAEAIPLRDVLCGHHDSTEVKVSVVQAIFSRDLNVVGSADKTAGGLLIERRAYKAFVQIARNRVAGNESTSREAAKVLVCDASTIPGLMKMGFLEGRKTPTGLRVTDESIEKFKQEFVSLASVARRMCSRSRALMRQCDEHSIELLLIPCGTNRGPQPFLRTSDAPRLLLMLTVEPSDSLGLLGADVREDTTTILHSSEAHF